MINSFGLYLILTNPAAGYESCAEAAVETGVAFLQLRMKSAGFDELLDTAGRLRNITLGSPTRFIINDNLEIAMEVDADGIHLGQDDLSVTEARARWNTAEKICGLSTHNLAQAQEAARLLPDYIGVGPVFATNTKMDTDPILGIEHTARIVQNVELPAFAIGGINEQNLPELLRAGIPNFCVVGAVNHSTDPAVAIRRLQTIWESNAF